MIQSQLWLCCLEGLRSTPKWGQSIRTGRYWEGQRFTGERGGYIKVRSMEEGDVGRQPLWNFPLIDAQTGAVWMVLSPATSSGHSWNNFCEESYFLEGILGKVGLKTKDVTAPPKLDI